MGHGPKMGQNGFDRACVSAVFLFLLCFIAHSYEANGGTDMEVLACFRPCFLNSFRANDPSFRVVITPNEVFYYSFCLAYVERTTTPLE